MWQQIFDHLDAAIFLLNCRGDSGGCTRQNDQFTKLPAATQEQLLTIACDLLRSYHSSDPVPIVHQLTDLNQLEELKLFPNKDNPQHTICMASLVSQNDRFTDQLLHLDKLSNVGILTSSIAHELVNPITGIINYAELLKRTLDKKAVTREDMDEILTAGNRCKEINKALLGFTRRSKVITTFDVNQIIDDCLVWFKTVLNQGQETPIHKILAPQSLNINGNAKELFQVFVNLLNNALHATDGAGEIFITSSVVTEPSHCFQVTIEDTGSGIAAENIHHVFDPFYTTKEEGKGTGLGLYVCKNIIKKFAGTIEVKSNIGQGTIFTITLQPFKPSFFLRSV